MTRLARVLGRSALPCLALIGVSSAPARAAAQLPPLEATRAGPHPASVAHGEALVFARSFASARVGPRVLVVYIENNGPSGALRSALFTVTAPNAPDAAPTLSRARDDVTLAPEARSVSLAWDGRRGAVAYVIPRAPSAALPPSQRAIRPPSVGVPAATDDPFGPARPSGGAVALLTLDETGVAQGASHAVFAENARLWRATVLREPDAWAVAWTGATVTDDEVRGTVRALRVRDDGSPARLMASATGWTGDPGEALGFVRVDGATVLVFSGARCAAREGLAAPPASLNQDPSARIDPPNRNPQPQATPRRAPGPPIECGPTSLHLSELRADHTFGPIVTGPWLRGDAVAITDDAVYAPLLGAPARPVFARVTPTRRGFGAIVDVVVDAPFALAAAPTAPPTSIENLTRPAPDADAPLLVNPVPPPALPTAETIFAARTAPRALGASSARGGALAVVTGDRRGLGLVRAGAGASLLATTPSLFHEVAVLGGADGRGAGMVLSREGVWSGPVRYFAVPPTGAPTALTLAEARVAPPPPHQRFTRFEARAPLGYDADFSRLFAHTRLLRAQLMRHENLAGMMAARPESPTDPRMPGLLAVRNRLRNRLESSCSLLRSRAVALARAGAGDDVVRGVQQLCEPYADLQLGVPVNPAL